MEHARNILRDLLHRALSEHGADAPALVDVSIQPASGRIAPRLWVLFANGYSTWAPVRPADFYTICERYGAWDLPGLRRALLHEGHDLYARMRAEHLAEIERARARRSVAASLLERLRWAGRRRNFAAAGREDQLPRRSEVQRRLLEWWAHQRHEYARTAFFAHDFSGEVGSKRAQERGLVLLKENLGPDQRQQYDKYGYFDVVGGKSGKRYRIRHGRQMNIEQLDKNGRRVCGWCFYPQGGLVAGDIMLAQKVALELFEADALKIANRF
ncbi:MAG: hypothetical protein AB7O44_22570 [Hyphomicrobiaceae bacterium]